MPVVSRVFTSVLPRSMSRLRMFSARRPWVRWLVVAAMAAAVGSIVVASLADIRRQRDAWGETRQVVVATRTISAGESMEGGWALRELPRALVPPSAVHEVSAVATATHPLALGEVVVEIDLVADRGPLALLPEGWLAIRVPDPTDTGAATASALFRIGDAATVLADGDVVGPTAIVVGIDSDALVIGLPAADAARVAQAANQRVAVVALGPG